MNTLTLFGFVLWILVVFQDGCVGKKRTNNTDSRNLQVQAVQTPRADHVRWIPGNYMGLKLGKANYSDVKRLFGKPRWEGGNEEKTFEKDEEFEILLQYSEAGVDKQPIELVIGEKTKILKALSFQPNPEMTRNQAISKYGTEYFEISTGEENFCIPDGSMRGPTKQELTYPIALVYPEQGLYVLVGKDEMVIHVGYLYKC